jgi:multidrug efflux pump subunit AcrB
LISLKLLPKESQPDIQIPIAIINTPFFGASALEVENQITKEIEKAVKNISAIEKIDSTSKTGFSSIVLQFNQDEDIDEKIQEIKESIDAIKNSFPQGTSEYKVTDVKSSDSPIFKFVIFSNENNFTLKKVSDELKEFLENIDGVSIVNFSGIPEFEYSILLDRKKFEQYNLSFSEIKQKILSSNILIPAGKLKVNNQEYIIDIKTKIKGVSDLENIPIKNFKNNILSLKDIAQVEKGFKISNTSSKIFFQDNKERMKSIVFSISKEADFNILDLSRNLKNNLKK